MIKIESDDPTIEKTVRFMETTILDHGGYFDPDILIKCNKGQLSVEKFGFNGSTKPLIAVPEELLLPSAKMNVSVKDYQMEMAPKNGDLTDTQLKMADALLELYNITNKIKIHEESSVWFSYKPNPEALKSLLKARALASQQEKFMDYTCGKSDTTHDTLLCDTYLKSRTIGHKKVQDEQEEAISENTEESGFSTMLMPIIDFINHHPAGAHFNCNKVPSLDNNKRFMALGDSRPILESAECYAYYNLMDTLDSLISYGFPDNHAPFVRSIPLEIDLPTGDKLVARGIMGGGQKGKVHKNLAPLKAFLPRVLTNDDSGLEVSHLIIPCVAGNASALRRVLRMLLSNKLARKASTQEIWETVLYAEDKILSENIGFYERLITECNEKNPDSTDKCWDLTSHVAKTQLTKLYKYRFEAQAETVEELDNSRQSAQA